MLYGDPVIYLTVFIAPLWHLQCECTIKYTGVLYNATYKSSVDCLGNECFVYYLQLLLLYIYEIICADNMFYSENEKI